MNATQRTQVVDARQQRAKAVTSLGLGQAVSVMGIDTVMMHEDEALPIGLGHLLHDVWNTKGINPLEIAIAALEDANYHTVVAKLRIILDEMN